jgi:hypothetical protein
MHSLTIGVAAILCLAAVSVSSAAELTVGPGQKFARLEDAVGAAKAGDTVVVFPQPANRPYPAVALFVRTPRLTIRAEGKERVPLSGTGFSYSGDGKIPRAIVQFGPGADGCVLQGFELFDAHNESHNGAGVRINQANDVTIRNCDIHGNDMGIMSNGDGTLHAGVNQLIEQCLIHGNGTDKDPGYNHNLYLGGTSVRLIACEIFGSTTGHNVKSRAHQTFILNCYIHDAANREIDLVDGKGDTTEPGSDAVIVGNVIVKDPKCAGNRGVIHFGQDGGHEHDGRVWLAQNTIVTPFVAPVVLLSAPKATARLINNIVFDGGSGQKGQVLVDSRKAGPTAYEGTNNWLSAGFGANLSPSMLKSHVAAKGEQPLFVDVDKRDYRPTPRGSGVIDAGAPLPAEFVALLGEKLYEIRMPLDRALRADDGKPDLGAYELKK